MALYRDHGIVLRTYKLGEADRIVVVLTPEHGKVRAVAKGARKATSRFGGRLEPTTHVSLLAYRGRGELDTLSQVETVDSFGAVRADLDRIGRAAALLEAVDQLSPEREPNVRRYQMLLGALRTLAAGDPPALVGTFYLKLLAAEGVGPALDACVECGSEEGLAVIGFTDGGVLCRSCRAGAAGALSVVSPAALDLARRALGGALHSVLAEPASPAVHELEVLATRALEHHVERRLRAPSVLGW